jgi:uncharacterized cupin superfamily protein
MDRYSHATMASAYTILHLGDLERTGKWWLARKSLGLQSFGLNVVEIPPGDDIPEHDETERDQEEVFVVIAGTPTMVIDGEEHATEAGTFVRVEPELRRTLVNRGADTARVLIASAPRTSGYLPMSWG